MAKKSIKEEIESTNPLSKGIVGKLLKYHEEDIYVDFKKTLDNKDKKGWLEFTKDVLAFSNTYGGYVVFGFEDKTFRQVDLTDEIYKELSDANQILQKINSYIQPPVKEIRTKGVKYKNKKTVVVHIPESEGRTHIVVKDGQYTQQSGQPKKILSPGMIWMRKSGGNYLIDPDGFDTIVDKRIHYFRDSLLSRIAQVIEAPPDKEVIFVKSTSKDSLIFEDVSGNPKSMPPNISLEDMRLEILPKTQEGQIDIWGVTREADPEYKGNTKILYSIYRNREEIKLTKKRFKKLAYFSLINDAPVFYWIKNLKKEELEEIIIKAFNNIPDISTRSHILRISSFLGKGFHSKILNKFGKKGIPKVSASSRKFPADPKSLICLNVVRSMLKVNKPENEIEFLVDKLNGHISKLAKNPHNREEIFYASAIDCHLYARDDKYKKVIKKEKKKT